MGLTVDNGCLVVVGVVVVFKMKTEQFHAITFTCCRGTHALALALVLLLHSVVACAACVTTKPTCVLCAVVGHTAEDNCGEIRSNALSVTRPPGAGRDLGDYITGINHHVDHRPPQWEVSYLFAGIKGKTVASSIRID